MAMGPERSKPLHNFTLPCLKWGNQRYLRCMKVTSDGGGAASSPSTEDRRSPGLRFENSTATRKRELESEMKQQFHLSGRNSEKRMKISKSRIDSGDGEDGIEAVREKIMLDLKTAADKMKDEILRKEAGEEEEENEEVDEKEEHDEPPAASAPSSAAAAAAAAEARPWNLRTRRAACKAPIADGTAKCLKIEEKKLINHSPPRTDNANGVVGVKSPPKSRASLDKPERTKITVPLSKREIEEDYMGLTGHRPPRRAKKRPRNVQKALDGVFPGLWLSEVTLDTYKVPETPDNGKEIVY